MVVPLLCSWFRLGVGSRLRQFLASVWQSTVPVPRVRNQSATENRGAKLEQPF